MEELDMKELEEMRKLLRERSRLLAAAEERAHEAEERAHEAEKRSLEYRRLREDVQALTLYQYLDICHSLSLSIKVVTDRWSTTTGETSNPTGRVYPRRIVPWPEFPREQEQIWDQLSRSSTFSLTPTFPSRHQLDYVRSSLRPVTSEIDLRSGEEAVVENAVLRLMDATYKDIILREHLKLDGAVTFENHTNLGVSSYSTSKTTGQGASGSQASRSGKRRRARGKGNRADQFCVYRTSDDKALPIVAIEYKPPHKLTLDELMTGLSAEVQPDRDVINQEGEASEFAARRLATAVVTQLFSYMIGKNIRRGYIDTGEAYVFLYIGNDPSCVYYYLCAPRRDVQGDDETRLHRSAVAQIFAFVLQAIQSPPPPQTWQDAIENLDVWPVEHHDILRDIPETVRKPQRVTPYKPSSKKGHPSSPARTRSCRPHTDHTQRSNSEDRDSDGQTPCPPSRSTINSRGANASASNQNDTREAPSSESSALRDKIEDQSYCTNECLQGLAFGGSVDKKCPNAEYHGGKHIEPDEFTCLIQKQLATYHGRDDDCTPLYISGSRGSLFKVRLPSHGYILVAKGVEHMDADDLHHENKIYGHLYDLQGASIPVCLGVIDLIKPYYYDCGVYTHFMLLSFAGRSILKLQNIGESDVNEIMDALKEIHSRQVLHCDAKPRNVLYDKRAGKYMIVDFMLSKLYSRRPLESMNINNRTQAKDAFAAETSSLLASLS
ncbi:hypothetical protein E4U55_006302 [Claviceps digitariae]|nr:hypothetical protein E4U55_006302 [Claviceps digitariae]